MAIEVERLVAVLEARITKFEKAMAKATGTADQSARRIEQRFNKMGATMDNSMGRAVDRLNKALAVFGVTLSAGFLLRMGRQALDAAGGLGELSQQLGISTDLLQTLQYSASQNGVEAAALESTIAKLTKTIGEAAAGEKAAVDAFIAGGISFKDYNEQARSTEDVLRDIAERIKNAKTEAERAKIATDFFGKAGQDLIPVLAKGSAGLDEFIARARELGLVLDDTGIDKADAASDKLTELELRFEKLTQRLAVLASGPLLEVATLLESIADTDGSVIDRLAALGNLANRLGPFGQVRDLVQDAFTADEPPPLNRSRLDRLSSSTNPPPLDPSLGAGAEEAAREAERRAEAIQKVVAALTLERDNLGRTSEQQRLYNELSRAGTDANTDAGQAITALVHEIETRVQAAEDLATAVEAEHALMEEGATLTESLMTAEEQFNALMQRAQELYDAKVISLETLTRAQRQYGQALTESQEHLRKSVDDTNNAIVGQADATSVAQSGISGLVSDLRNGVSAADAFVGAIRNVIDQLIQLALQQAILKIVSSFSGGYGQVAGSAVSAFAQAHDGGIVGRDRFKRSSRGAFRTNERLMLLEKDEEVLTRNDPRHRFNIPRRHRGGLVDMAERTSVPQYGGRSASPVVAVPAPQVIVRNVNAFDGASFLSEALANPTGERVVLNYFSANSRSIRSALGLTAAR